MCLALPARIVHLDGDRHALVDAGGIRQRISIELLEEARPGDWVLIHVGYALAPLDADAARATLALTEQLAARQPGGGS